MGLSKALRALSAPTTLTLCAKEIISMNIEKETEILQDELSLIDMLSAPSSGSRGLQFLVKKLGNIKIKMYQETGHSMPHIHIDYGHNNHMASYDINNGNRLAGNLNKKYDKKIRAWVEKNQAELVSLWNNAQDGNNVEMLIAEIKGNT